MLQQFFLFWPYASHLDRDYQRDVEDSNRHLSLPIVPPWKAAYRAGVSQTYLDEALWPRFEKALDRGRPISDWPEVAPAWHDRAWEPLLDVFYVWCGTRTFGVSRRAREVLEPFCRDEVQFLPFETSRDEEPDYVIRDLFVLHVVRRIRALDPQRSTFFNDWRDLTPEGDYIFLDKPVLIARRIKGAAIFRCHGVVPSRLLMRGDVQEAVERAGLTGFVFEEVELVD